MLWRLNHELFPDPGSPIAKTTTPLDGRELALAGATWGIDVAWLGISLAAALDAAPSPLPRGAVPFRDHGLFPRDLCGDASFVRNLRRRKERSPGSIRCHYFPARAREIQRNRFHQPFPPRLR
jgi:hypothetical protein